MGLRPITELLARILRWVWPVVALVALFGCASKIKLPTSFPADAPPPGVAIVAVNQADGNDIRSVDSTKSPMVNMITVPSGMTYRITGSAWDHTYGVKTITVSVAGPTGSVLATESQTPDHLHRVFDSLEIAGTDGNGNPGGIPLTISPLATGVITVTVIVKATNFASKSSTMLANFEAPTSPSTGATPRPTTPPVSPTPGGTPSSAEREQGPFVEVVPIAAPTNMPILSPDHSYIMRLSPGSSVSGTQKEIAQFSSASTGSGFSVQFIPGGAQFTAKSTRAVVESLDPTVANEVDYSVYALPSALTTMSAAKVTAYSKDPSPGPAGPAMLSPRIFFSPDSTLALVIGAPVAGTSAAVMHLDAVDLTANTIATPLYNQNVFGGFSSAKVIGKTIVVTLNGGQPIPPIAVP